MITIALHVLRHAVSLLCSEPLLKVVERMQDATVFEGGKAVFRCVLSLSDAKIVWMKNGKILQSEKNKCVHVDIAMSGAQPTSFCVNASCMRFILFEQ